jgi:YVTN family beta-propeller protein
VASFRSNMVSVIDTASNRVIATIPVGVGPCTVAVDPAGSHVYVTNHDPDPVQGDYRVSVIDTASNREGREGPGRRGPDRCGGGSERAACLCCQQRFEFRISDRYLALIQAIIRRGIVGCGCSERSGGRTENAVTSWSQYSMPSKASNFGRSASRRSEQPRPWPKPSAT